MSPSNKSHPSSGAGQHRKARKKELVEWPYIIVDNVSDDREVVTILSVEHGALVGSDGTPIHESAIAARSASARDPLALTLLQNMGAITRNGAKLTCNTEILQSVAEAE